VKAVSIDRYLRTSYQPEREYVDGEIVKRNCGTLDHSSLMGELIFFFGSREKIWNVHVFPILRIQVSETRVRVPDVCVYTVRPKEQVPRTPPFICIEILSPEDRAMSMQEKIDDYLKFGVAYVWVINPVDQRAWVCSQAGNVEIRDGVLRTENPPLEVRLKEIFDDL
jgi:Uma2 family endonuclease